MGTSAALPGSGAPVRPTAMSAPRASRPVWLVLSPSWALSAPKLTLSCAEPAGSSVTEPVTETWLPLRMRTGGVGVPSALSGTTTPRSTDPADADGDVARFAAAGQRDAAGVQGQWQLGGGRPVHVEAQGQRRVDAA